MVLDEFLAMEHYAETVEFVNRVRGVEQVNDWTVEE